MNDFVIGKNSQIGVVSNEIAGPQNDDLLNSLESETPGENSASPSQVIKRKITNKVRKEIDSVVAAIENWVHDAILTAMDDLVTPRVEMAVKSISG